MKKYELGFFTHGSYPTKSICNNCMYNHNCDITDMIKEISKFRFKYNENITLKSYVKEKEVYRGVLDSYGHTEPLCVGNCVGTLHMINKYRGMVNVRFQILWGVNGSGIDDHFGVSFYNRVGEKYKSTNTIQSIYNKSQMIEWLNIYLAMCEYRAGRKYSNTPKYGIKLVDRLKQKFYRKFN